MIINVHAIKNFLNRHCENTAVWGSDKWKALSWWSIQPRIKSRMGRELNTIAPGLLRKLR